MDKGIRCSNFLIDILCVFIISIVLDIISIILDIYLSNFLLVFFLYCFISESIFRQTFGKYLTKTIVVNRNGTKPNTFKIFTRTLL